MDKSDIEQIDKSFDRFFPGIFGGTNGACSMGDREFTDAESVDLGDRDDIAMHLSPQVELVENYSTVNSERTATIIDAIIDKHTSESSCNLGDDTHPDWIFALYSPSSHEVEIVGDKFVIEFAHICRVVLSITIEREDELSSTLLKPSIHSDRLPIISAKFDSSDSELRILLRRLDDLLPGTITRPIIDQDQLP